MSINREEGHGKRRRCPAIEESLPLGFLLRESSVAPPGPAVSKDAIAVERGHCRGAASTVMCVGVLPGPPAWGADRRADLSRHSGRSNTPRSSKHARGYWCSMSGTPTASNGRGKMEWTRGMLTLGDSWTWVRPGSASRACLLVSFLSAWHQEMLGHTARKGTEPPTQASLLGDPKAPDRGVGRGSPSSTRKTQMAGGRLPAPKSCSFPGTHTVTPHRGAGPPDSPAPHPSYSLAKAGLG